MDLQQSEKQLARRITQKLYQAYGEPRWRRPLPPLDELVSTILSQNTNDGNRDRAFEALRQRFPTWEAVRDAPLEAVVEAIRPAGLAEQKGPRIQALLRAITEQRGGLDLEFLRDLEADEASHWLQQFKGVGPKTAAIVLLFSLNKPAFPVDTHIHRVTRRLGLLPQSTSAEKAHRLLAELFDARDYASVHLNLIRLGREICQARKPKCSLCPLKEECAFYRRENRS